MDVGEGRREDGAGVRDGHRIPLTHPMRDVIGHRRLLDRLAAHAASGEVAHAYGLFGPRSIGKRTVALRLAQSLNCLTKTPGGCGTCVSCRKIERGIHPDVRLVT